MDKKISIIHLCEDQKFINSAVEQFEYCFPGCNVFYVLSENESKLMYVRTSDGVFVVKSKELREVNVPENALVILHSLPERFYDFVLQLPYSVPIIWFCFGFEVYNDGNYFKNRVLLDKITRQKFTRKGLSLTEKLKEKIYPYYRFFMKSQVFSRRERKNLVFKRINYLATSFEEEFSQICKLIRLKKESFVFWYFPLELVLDVNTGINLDKKTILIGNSGFKTGNHLDVFAKIKNYPLGGMKIITPLNYGDEDYIEFISEQGKAIFGDKFLALLDFMPLSDYNSILDIVGVAILNNRRQQAVGNTIALLWFGAKVFLSEQNSFYHFLKRTGIHVYCYETELNAESYTQLLSLNEIEHNRKVLLETLNKGYLAISLKQQIAKICKVHFV